MAENHVLLETVELSQTTTTITFDNIPQTGYTDLKFVMSLRAGTSTSVESWDLLVDFNGDSSNKTTSSIRGDGSGVNYNAVGDRLLRLINPSDYTSNVYSNVEFYVPNYTGNKNKVFDVNSVIENNATGSGQIMIAGVWANTAPITSMAFTSTGSGSVFVAGTSISLYGITSLGTTPTVAPLATGGNIVANDGTYWYHAFLSSGTFTPQIELTCDLLVVAGGGAGGGQNAGGGGAGGLLGLTSQSLTATNHTVLVGAGGTSIYTGLTTSGSNSQFASLTAAVGGGNGGAYWGGGSTTVGSGGSGGGARGIPSNPGSGGAGTEGQGNAGGSTSGSTGYAGGGGGGAGSAGSSPSGNEVGGNGGVGSSTYSSWGSTTNTGQNSSGTRYYAGGGGGGGENTNGSGGLGGGGNAGATTPQSGTANTGGGGGGARGAAAGGAGGSGIVIIKYAMA